MLVLIFILLLTNEVEGSKLNLLESFVSKITFKNVVIWGEVLDQDLEDILQVSDQYSLPVNIWNGSLITTDDNALFVFLEPTFDDIENLLNQKGAQNSLYTNTWLIHVERSIYNVSRYFQNSNLRIGLNAKLFFATNHVLQDEPELIQIIGTGLKMSQYEVKLTYDGYSF